MAGVCNLAHIGERTKLCHSFGEAEDLLLAVCMVVQEVADMLFQQFGVRIKKELKFSEMVLG